MSSIFRSFSLPPVLQFVPGIVRTAVVGNAQQYHSTVQYASPLMQSWTAWCNSNERERGKKEGEGTGRKSRRTEEGGGGPDFVGNAVR